MPHIRGVSCTSVPQIPDNKDAEEVMPKAMRHLRLSRRGKNMAKMANILESTRGQILFKTFEHYFMIYYQSLTISSTCFLCNIGVHLEMIDFDSGKGPNVSATAPVPSAGATGQAGIAGRFRKHLTGYAIIAGKRKRSSGPKDVVYGRALP